MKDSYEKFIRNGSENQNINFVQEIFKTHLGIILPDTFPSLLKEGEAVNKNDLKSGDLIFFDEKELKEPIVGVYYGRNSFVYIGKSGLRSSTLKNDYWSKRYSTARRYA